MSKTAFLIQREQSLAPKLSWFSHNQNRFSDTKGTNSSTKVMVTVLHRRSPKHPNRLSDKKWKNSGTKVMVTVLHRGFPKDQNCLSYRKGTKSGTNSSRFFSCLKAKPTPLKEREQSLAPSHPDSPPDFHLCPSHPLPVFSFCTGLQHNSCLVHKHTTQAPLAFYL